MPYCPKCRYEYRENIEVCADCGVDLVDALPPDIDENYEDAEWVEAHTFPGSLYSRMAVEMLHMEGIPAYSLSEFGGGAGFGPTGGDFVGSAATVFVLDADLEAAMSIIEPMIDELPNHNEDEDDTDD